MKESSRKYWPGVTQDSELWIVIMKILFPAIFGVN